METELNRLRSDIVRLRDASAHDRSMIARTEEEMRVILRQGEKKDQQIMKLQQIIKLMQSTI